MSAKDLPEIKNIVLIISHDTGTEFGCYGSQISTPNIDRMAQDGIRFENHFCTAPQCTPSRGSILTGKMPHSNGLMGLTNQGWNLPEHNLTIPKILKQNGFQTNLLGLQHTHQDAKKLGYDFVSPRKFFPHYATSVVRAVRKWVKTFEGKEKGDYPPFYTSIGFFETHRPFASPDKFKPDPTTLTVPPHLPDTPAIRNALSEFYGMQQTLDIAVGKVMKLMESAPFYNETLFIISVDHGIPFQRAKCTTYDPGIRTPLILHHPKWKGKNLNFSGLASNVDILPTILDLFSLPIPAGIQGKSLYPILLGTQDRIREEIFAEMNFHNHGLNPIRCIRTKKWKFIKNLAPWPTLFEIPDDFYGTPDGISYREHHPEFETPRPTEELYNLEDDPGETHNLAGNPEYTAIQSELGEKLIAFLTETKDPALSDPEGIRVPDMPTVFNI